MIYSGSLKMGGVAAAASSSPHVELFDFAKCESQNQCASHSNPSPSPLNSSASYIAVQLSKYVGVPLGNCEHLLLLFDLQQLFISRDVVGYYIDDSSSAQDGKRRSICRKRFAVSLYPPW